jgi:hypothetical protein
MNYLGRSALGERHVEGGDDELGAQVRFHGPVDDATTPGIAPQR